MLGKCSDFQKCGSPLPRRSHMNSTSEASIPMSMGGLRSSTACRATGLLLTANHTAFRTCCSGKVPMPSAHGGARVARRLKDMCLWSREVTVIVNQVLIFSLDRRSRILYWSEPLLIVSSNPGQEPYRFRVELRSILVSLHAPDILSSSSPKSLRATITNIKTY